MSLMRAGPDHGVGKAVDRRVGCKAVQPFQHDVRPARGVAGVLGVAVRFDSLDCADDLKRRQAEAKAKEIISSVQGTSALEGQAVDDSVLGRAIESALHEFLGSNRKLWAS